MKELLQPFGYLHHRHLLLVGVGSGFNIAPEQPIAILAATPWHPTPDRSLTRWIRSSANRRSPNHTRKRRKSSFSASCWSFTLEKCFVVRSISSVIGVRVHKRPPGPVLRWALRMLISRLPICKPKAQCLILRDQRLNQSF